MNGLYFSELDMYSLSLYESDSHIYASPLSLFISFSSCVVLHTFFYILGKVRKKDKSPLSFSNCEGNGVQDPK